MIPTAWRSRVTPIGVEIDGRRLSAVQLEPVSDGFRLRAAASVLQPGSSEPFDAAQGERLARILERQGFTGTSIVLAVPPQSLMTAVLELPSSETGAPLGEIAKAELANAHKCDPDTISAAYWDLPEPARSTRGTCVMAVGCPEEDATALLDAVESVGLTVCALDVRSLAQARACTPLLRDMTGLAAILNLGWLSADLIVQTSGVVVYERTLLEAGLNGVLDDLVADLDLDVDVADYVLREIGLDCDTTKNEAQREIVAAVRDRTIGYLNGIIPEIRLSLGYAAQEYGRTGIDRLLLVGEAAGIPGLAKHVSREFGLEATVVAPADLLIADKAPTDLTASPALTAAFGLAQYPIG